MNKHQLVEAFREATSVSHAAARTTVDTFFEKISEAIASGDRVELRGLCSFSSKQYKPYTGRNPKTGKKIEVNPKRLPSFKAGVELKQRVNAKRADEKKQAEEQAKNQKE